MKQKRRKERRKKNQLKIVRTNDNLAIHKFADVKRQHEKLCERAQALALCHGSVICLQIHRNI